MSHPFDQLLTLAFQAADDDPKVKPLERARACRDFGRALDAVLRANRTQRLELARVVRIDFQRLQKVIAGTVPPTRREALLLWTAATSPGKSERDLRGA